MFDLIDTLRLICKSNPDALTFITEGWLVSELYSAIKKQSESLELTPFPIEVPYVTVYPLSRPKKENRDWTKIGGVKLADLCLRGSRNNDWYWYEIKSREFNKWNKNQKIGVDVFKKDTVALSGFDIAGTIDTWKYPDKNTKTYQFEAYLNDHIDELENAKHHFRSLYLQLGDPLDPVVWNNKYLQDQIQSFKRYQQIQSGRDISRTVPDLNLSQYQIDENVYLVLAEW